jgi:hypothetical protein
MKILFAYFGQPRYVYENMPNHIALMKQIKNSLVSYDGVHIDILFSTTPIENTIVEKIESIAPSDMNVKFDFISELARADIASSIHSKLKSNYFHKHDVITICHQIISIHMLASKIDKEYDAVYVLRTDMLFATYKTQFDFSFLGHFIGKSDLDYKIFVTDMKQVVSERKQSMDVNDQIFLTSKSTLRDLYFDDFQESISSFLDDSYAMRGKDTIRQINDYHSIFVGFMINSFNSDKFKNNGKVYTIEQFRIAPFNSITRHGYSNTSYIDATIVNEIINDRIIYDHENPKNFHIPPEWFADKE